MFKHNLLPNLFAAVAVLTACSTSKAQEAVNLQEDGSLAGKAFVVETAQTAADAKITLTQDGQVISTVNADGEGNFAFQSVEPGAYDLLGASDSYVGQASYAVAPYASGGCSSCSMQLSAEPAEVAYSTCGSAPAQSFSSSPCGCNGGGGFGGGGGLLGRGGAFGGGGLLGSPLLRLGAIGGIVAIAVSDDDDDDDASPDN